MFAPVKAAEPAQCTWVLNKLLNHIKDKENPGEHVMSGPAEGSKVLAPNKTYSHKLSPNQHCDKDLLGYSSH